MIIRLLRIDQYTKNLFVFLPMFFGMRATDTTLLLKTFLVFLSFSLISSATYVYNDCMDVNEDKKHPKKRLRPIASGVVSVGHAYIFMAALASMGFALAGIVSPSTLKYFFIYVAASLAYSRGLKHIAVLDVMLISALFVIRLMIGASVGNITLSSWIVIMTFLLSLFLALAKRRDDLMIYLRSRVKTRLVIDGYNIRVLDTSLSMLSGVIIVSYIMYSLSPEVAIRTNNAPLYMTVVFVIYGIIRYLQITFVEKVSGSPSDVLIKDKGIFLSVLGWFASIAYILYIHPAPGQ